ncbi:MAG: hypothetical protein JNM72_15960 [Deltaproteobacteria bacterium]|nr:hypothetical protein [Deltaproteobacteria bacterium]
MSGEWTHLDPESCPVCGLRGGHPLLEGARALLRCERCGDHWVDEPVWRHLKAGQPVQTRRRLTAALRTAMDKGRKEHLLGPGTPTERVERLIAPVQPLDTVAQRMDALLVHLAQSSPAFGAPFTVGESPSSSAYRQSLAPEDDYTLAKGLVALGLCDGEAVDQMGASSLYVDLTLTPAGWERYEQLRTTSTGSTRVFVALSNHYGKGLNDDAHAKQADALLDAIRAALPPPLFGYRVEKDAAVDQITDAIIAGIRRAPFVIADLTAERPNVYFEAGLALGLGKPVVFCRRKGETAHFDVQAYKLIEWEPDELGDFTRRLDAHLQARGLTPARDPG